MKHFGGNVQAAACLACLCSGHIKEGYTAVSKSSVVQRVWQQLPAYDSGGAGLPGSGPRQDNWLNIAIVAY
jgi:hypothetical protein